MVLVLVGIVSACCGRIRRVVVMVMVMVDCKDGMCFRWW